MASSTETSGLTPYIGRTTLNTPRRRVSTPASTRTRPVEYQFTPLRQALDDRTKRRIRRRGLSEEMNAYESERKDKVQLEKELRAKDQELQKLKDELDAVRHANDPADHQTVEALSSSQRTIEAELDDLRQSFNEANTPNGFDDDMDINWDAVNVHKSHTTPGPASEGGDTILIHEDDADMKEPRTPSGKSPVQKTTELVDTAADAEILAMAIDLESAKQEKRRLFKDLRAHLPPSQLFMSKSKNFSSSLHFEDSPAASQQHDNSFRESTNSLPSPPKTFYADLSKALKSTTHRAEAAELALHSLEVDLQTLGFSPSDESSTTTILENIRTHFREARLDLERALPGETTTGLNEAALVLPSAISKLKLLSRRVQEREAELHSMHEQQRTLKGNFECSLRAAEKANQRIKELEDAIEEGADDLLSIRMKVQSSEKDSAEKDSTISSLISALEKYRADLTRLEGLVITLENEQAFKLQEAAEETAERISDLEAHVAAEQTGRQKAEESAVSRLAQIKELSAALDVARADASAMQLQLSSLESVQRSQTQEQDAQHEAALQHLNTRISGLSTTLAASHAESTRLQARVKILRERVRTCEEEGTRVVEALWREQVRSATKCGEIRKSCVRGWRVRGANWDMEDEDEDRETEQGDGEGEPMTPVSLVRFVDVEPLSELEAEASSDGLDTPDGDRDGEVEGRVEIARGRNRGPRSRSASRPLQRSKGLGIEMSMSMNPSKQKKDSRGRRRLDSGIGMSSLLSAEEDADDDAEALDGTNPCAMLSSDTVLSPSSDSGFDIHEDASNVVLPSSELGMQE